MVNLEEKEIIANEIKEILKDEIIKILISQNNELVKALIISNISFKQMKIGLAGVIQQLTYYKAYYDARENPNG